MQVHANLEMLEQYLDETTLMAVDQDLPRDEEPYHPTLALDDINSGHYPDLQTLNLTKHQLIKLPNGESNTGNLHDSENVTITFDGRRQCRA